MRPKHRIDRRGPGLIENMSRSAVIASGPGALGTISPGRSRQRADRAEEASDRYRQLCDLLEHGILAPTEFEAAVRRLTSGFSSARDARVPWSGIRSPGVGDDGSGRSH